MIKSKANKILKNVIYKYSNNVDDAAVGKEAIMIFF